MGNACEAERFHTRLPHHTGFSVRSADQPLLFLIKPEATIRRSHLVILAAWCGLLFVYGIAAGPLYRTESLRAIIGRECLQGEWLFPVLYGEPFLTKPPGHYAAIGVCSLPFGHVTVATARIPSVLAATCAVFLVYGLFRRAIDERAALLAALLLPASVLWLDKVPSAEIDMTLVGWVTAALVLVHRAIERQSASCWILALLCVAAGTLTKWTAPAFFYLTVVPLCLWRGELRVLFGWRHLLACGIAAFVCAGWVFAVSQQIGWESLADTVRKEALYRFSAKPSAKGVYPWAGVATYPLLVFVAHLPLSLFALVTFRPSFWAQWDDRGKRLLQLLHCWAWPNLLFWTLVPNHNVRYALPMSPALMGLGVMGLLGTRRGGSINPRWIKIGVLAFLTTWLAVKVAFVEYVVQNRAAKYDPIPAATTLRAHVPENEPLYLFRLKDEGVMFSFGRRAIRLHHPQNLPAGAFAVLLRQEWEDRPSFGHLDVVTWMHDQQGDAIVLVRSPVADSIGGKPRE